MPASNLKVQIERSILFLREQRVMLDFQLAELYEVETRVLKQAVRRNMERFPADFMFELTADEISDLRSQFVISSSHGGSRHGYFAFTEQGVAMLSTVLGSKRAIQVNISIMRAFVHLSELLASNADLARKLAGEYRDILGKDVRPVLVVTVAAAGSKPAAPSRIHSTPCGIRSASLRRVCSRLNTPAPTRVQPG